MSTPVIVLTVDRAEGAFSNLGSHTELGFWSVRGQICEAAPRRIWSMSGRSHDLGNFLGYDIVEFKKFSYSDRASSPGETSSGIGKV